MRARFGVVALMFSACVAPQDEPTELRSAALGTVPATETATWTRVGKSDLPDERYGQATAFDQTRGVAVMFGGLTGPEMLSQQDIWEWSPTLGAWKDRTITGTKPSVRSGAAMAYDSARKKFVLFGGRAGSGYNLQDTWEWDPDTGVWTDKAASGAKPEARCLHGMVFDSKNGKVLLFGGGRTQVNGEIMTLVSAFDDTWEYDGATATWAKRTTTAAPSTRGDFGFAYSSDTGKAYLFGGYEVLSSMGTPKQDTWEWDGKAGTWTERTLSGDKPSSRFGHSMAIDSVKGLAAILGGYDINTGGSMNDLWYWNLATGAWEGHDQPASATTWPQPRQWSSMVSNPTTGRLYVIAGQVYDSSGSIYGPIVPSRQVWELDPATTTWLNRSAPSNSPGLRTTHAMAADPVTGKVYVFGGMDSSGATSNDMWEWDGSKWIECTGDIKPSPRSNAAMAYDPVRKSLVLFGGMPDYYLGYGEVLADTWEWNLATRKWTQLTPTRSPGARAEHGMVTDTARNKIILYSGTSPFYKPIPYPYPVDAGAQDGGSSVPTENQIWEWDGASNTWTERSPPANLAQPGIRLPPAMVFDEVRKKVAVFGAEYYASANYWEWDPESGGWSQRQISDTVDLMNSLSVGYDSIRRRVVQLGESSGYSADGYPTASTYELDPATPTWYLRKIDNPTDRFGATMAFDNRRGVMVLFGGSLASSGYATDETWEYKVTGWGNGEGCTTEFAAQCASGNCVDGVCCESASCSGACKSCNVPGKAGTCVLANPGTQIAGSCSGDKACDSTGACKTSNGKACTSAADCASGFCTDGVCCDSACTGACKSCGLAGKVGACSPYTVGTDPEQECGKGTVPCQSSCDGTGACVFPSGNSCGTCGTCNGYGTCNEMLYCPTTGVRTSRGTGAMTGVISGVYTGVVTASPTSLYTGISTSPSATAIGTGTGSLVTGRGTGTGTGTVTLATGTGTGSGTALLTGRGTGTGTSTGILLTGTGTGTRTGTGATVTGTASATGPTLTATGTAIGATGSAIRTFTGNGTGTSTAAPQTGSGTSMFTAIPSATNTATSSQTKADAGAVTPKDAGAADGSGKAAVKLGQSGCSCDLGSSHAQGLGMETLLGVLGGLLVWRRKRR